MHDFKFRKGELYCEKVSVREVARKVGTPFYLYSHKTLSDHFLKLKRAFASVDPLICFSMKSNGNLSVIKTLLNLGSGIDIVSMGELQKALKAGADPRKIVFASVGKTDQEIAFAIRKNILFFNVESVPELENINRVARKMKRKVQVALRINPDVDAATHQAITTGTLSKKFGIDLKNARRVLKSQARFSHVRMNGLHIHIGSQITSQKPFIQAMKRITRFLTDLRTAGVCLEYLNIGGGLGIIYKDEKPQNADQFAHAVLPYLKKSGLKIIMEPGRFITGNAGIFVTKMLYFKDNGFKKFFIVDGGMNDLIRPSLYHAYQEIVPVVKRRARTVKVDVVGPICESGDFLGKDRRLPMLKKNDLLAVMSAGAYGYTMSSNYNMRCRVPEVMVKGNQFSIVKRRETFKDLAQGETIPSFLINEAMTYGVKRHKS
ncbi:MAG: diaminopimelate decarboxylase [Candidatus Omnitrophota bacterium]